MVTWHKDIKIRKLKDTFIKIRRGKRCEDNAVDQDLFASSGRYVSLCKLYNSTRLARKKGITLASLVSSTSSTLWEITFLQGLRAVSREKYTADGFQTTDIS